MALASINETKGSRGWYPEHKASQVWPCLQLLCKNMWGADSYMGFTVSCTNSFIHTMNASKCSDTHSHSYTYTHTHVCTPCTHPHLWKALRPFLFPGHTCLTLCSRAPPCPLGMQVLMTPDSGGADTGPRLLPKLGQFLGHHRTFQSEHCQASWK